MTFKEQVLQIIREHEKTYNPVDDYVTTNELGWLYEEIRSLNENPWHTGTPTEKGWYVCKLKGVDIYETHNYTGNNWCEYVQKWQKIAKEEANNGTDN